MADATLAESIKAGIAQVITDTGLTVTYNDNSYTVGMGTRAEANQYDPLGEMEGYTNTLTFLTDDLTANLDDPQPGEKITIDLKDYRILDVTKAAFDEVTRIDIGDEF